MPHGDECILSKTLLYDVQVLLPYAHAKLSALYERRSSPLQSFAPPGASAGQLPPVGQQDDAAAGQRQQQQQRGWRRPLQQQFQQLDVRLGGGLSAAATRLRIWRQYLHGLALHAFIKVGAALGPGRHLT
jgi:hypothetical protein